jgi:hypothetical protein
VCSVRETGEGYRGFRAGILSLRTTRRLRGWSAGFAPVLCVLAAVSVLSCTREEAKPPEPPAAVDPRAAWYQISEGKFIPIASITAAAQVLPQPWTVQTRISDSVFMANTVVMAVNGYGLAAVDLRGNQPAFAYFFDSTIFAHRTVTTLVRTASGVTAHLYFNQMLNTVGRPDLKIGGICLVGFLPGSGEYVFIMPPFQKRNPEWEAVGFVAASASDYFFEWKQWGETETRFGYTRFNPDAGTESSIDRETYIGAYKLSAGAAPGGAALRTALFSMVRSELNPGESAAIHFTLRSRADAVKRVFRSGEGVTSITTVPVWEEKGLALALMPEGRILSTADGTAFTSIALPQLPQGFRYTDLVRSEGALILPWEQTLFTDVRAAGFLLFRP